MENIQNKSKLEHLLWNQDPHKSVVNYFVDKLGALGDGCNLRKVELSGIFMQRENRQQLRKKLEGKQIELVLFNPDFTDDESEDHDCTEDDTVDDDGADSPDEEGEKEDDDDA